MFTFIGFIIVSFIILYKRSTEIIVVNPLQGRRQAPLPGSPQGRAAIIKLVENNRFIEAMQLYRRLYGVDLQTAKKAVDKMMLER